MGNKKVLITTLILFVAGSLVLLFKLFKIANSCALDPSRLLYLDSSCSGEPIEARFPAKGYSGCGLVFVVDVPVYYKECFIWCNCKPDAPFPITMTPGSWSVCRVYADFDCNYVEGLYDTSTQKCVICDGKIKTEMWYCLGDYRIMESVFQCESACGADACCDDVDPNSYIRRRNCKGYCSSECYFTPWAINITANTTLTTIGKAVRITAMTNLNLPGSGYCIVIFEKRLGNTSIIKRCYSGNSCSVDVVKNQTITFNYSAAVGICSEEYGTVEIIEETNNITVRWVECLNDYDCEGGYRCDTSSGKCYVSCDADAQCKSGYYCYCQVCSRGWTNGQCSQNQCCNRGYGGSGIGSCVNLGTIYNSGSISYICA